MYDLSKGFETKRLIFKPLCLSELENYIKISQSKDFKYSAFDNTKKSITEFLTRGIEASQKKDTQGRNLTYKYSLYLKNAGQLIGYVACGADFRDIKYGQLFGDLGYELGVFLHSSYWGEGLGYEATQGLIKELVAHNIQKRFFTIVSENNIASVKTIQKRGFIRHSLTAEQHIFLANKYKEEKHLYSKSYEDD